MTRFRDTLCEMHLSEIARAGTQDVAPDATFAELRSLLADADTDGVLVVDGDRLGVVTQHDLVRSHVRDGGPAAHLAGPVPALDRSATVRDAARLLVQDRTPVAPVFDGGERWGTVTRDDLLAATVDELATLAVGDVRARPVVTVAPDATVGEAIDALRENTVARLPVVDDENRLVGIVTAGDVVGFLSRDGDGAPEDYPRSLDLPVSAVMSQPVETTTPDASLAEAVERMLQTGYDGLVVCSEPDDRVAGVVTKTDALRALPRTASDAVDVEVVNADLLRSTTPADIEDRIAALADRYGDLAVRAAHVRLQRLDRPTRGRPLVLCDVRLWTADGRFATTGEGDGADNALRLAFYELERRLRDRERDRDEAAPAVETTPGGHRPAE